MTRPASYSPASGDPLFLAAVLPLIEHNRLRALARGHMDQAAADQRAIEDINERLAEARVDLVAMTKQIVGI